MTQDPDSPGGSPEAMSPSKVATDTLSLRARPPRVVRFRRGLMIGAAAIGAIGLSGLAWFALSPRTFQMTKAADEPQAADRGRRQRSSASFRATMPNLARRLAWGRHCPAIWGGP